jgi:cell division protein FtsN
MGHDFYPGMVCGIVIGVLVTMIGLAIFCRTAAAKTAPETKNDPADWWKRGEKPPHEED